MALFNASVIIRELRKARGLTQEQLAEGICSRSTVNMIEQGKRKPDWHTFSSILLKLGVNPQLYSDIATEDDVHIRMVREECEKHISAWDFEALKIEVDKMERDKRFSTGEGRDAYIRIKASLHSQGPYRDSQLALNYQWEQIKTLRPDFDLNKIPGYHLAVQEIIIINSMATSYQYLEGQEKAIEILLMLQASLESDYKKSIRDEALSKQYWTNINNLCFRFKQTARYDECIETAEKGIKLYNGNLFTLNYMWCVYFKAFSLMKLGNMQEGEPLYKKFLLYTFIFDGYAHLDRWYRDEFEKEFGYRLDLSLDWDWQAKADPPTD
jgi:transcriptional regulator with XRE-family HTH domain